MAWGAGPHEPFDEVLVHLDMLGRHSTGWETAGVLTGHHRLACRGPCVAGACCRLAQCCIAQPPATRAAPTSASRSRSSPVVARADRTPELVPVFGSEGAIGVEPGPVTIPPPVAGGRSERAAPAAGFEMKISGAIHAAAPAATPVETPLRSVRRVMRPAEEPPVVSPWPPGSLCPVGSLSMALLLFRPRLLRSDGLCICADPSCRPVPTPRWKREGAGGRRK